MTTGAQATPEPFPIAQSEIQKVPQKYRRRMVRFERGFAPGTILIDTRQKFLYLIQPGGRAMRYGIGVGRQGFSWSGTAVIRRKAKWPRWTPPASMVERDEFAAEWAGGMPGGPRNPLGARALYLFQGDVDTLYRIHGTFVPSSIGKAVSSGCIRMLNADVADLYERVPIGTRVVVQQNSSHLFAEDEDLLPRKRNRRKFLFFGSD
jgi:lipoprotein-anchoring transpeptidase ErfK/SrfK